MLTPDFEDYYRLQSMLGEENSTCLESNRVAPDAFLDGAAYMDDCQDVSGQLWRFVDAGDGSYYLQSLYLQEENFCLEGNRVAEDAILDGAAFMDTCQDVTGQRWTLVPVSAE